VPVVTPHLAQCVGGKKLPMDTARSWPCTSALIAARDFAIGCARHPLSCMLALICKRWCRPFSNGRPEARCAMPVGCPRRQQCGRLRAEVGSTLQCTSAQAFQDDATARIGWVTVGDPAPIGPRETHDEIRLHPAHRLCHRAGGGHKTSRPGSSRAEASEPRRSSLERRTSR
jgi:hypothetical protein